MHRKHFGTAERTQQPGPLRLGSNTLSGLAASRNRKQHLDPTSASSNCPGDDFTVFRCELDFAAEHGRREVLCDRSYCGCGSGRQKEACADHHPQTIVDSDVPYAAEEAGWHAWQTHLPHADLTVNPVGHAQGEANSKPVRRMYAHWWDTSRPAGTPPFVWADGPRTTSLWRIGAGQHLNQNTTLARGQFAWYPQRKWRNFECSVWACLHHGHTTCNWV